MFLLWFSHLACNAPDATPEPPQDPLPPAQPAEVRPGPRSGPSHPGPARAPRAPTRPGVTWTEALAVEVELIPAKGSCADEDGDGSFHALACPGASPARLDCDDADPLVTADTERWVRPGPFLMGSDVVEAGDDESPVHVVHLAGYCMDRDEVTAAQFSAWLKRSRRRPQGADLRSLTASGDVVSGREQHPASGVTWSEATSYCRAQGKLLPTEAQWEKASRGGCELGASPTRCDRDDLRIYPWGNTAPSCGRANHQSSSGGPPTPCVGDTLPVGSLPEGNGPYGHRDLSGNVWEYVSDSYHPSVYSANRTRVDPAGPRGGSFHVLRGGGWSTFSTNMRAANRFHDLVMGSGAGFRCVRSVAAPIYDPVTPLSLVTLSGTISFPPPLDEAATPVSLSGRAIYVTAFAKSDLRPDGTPILGRSPSAEIRLEPDGQPQLNFTLRVPQGRVYLIQVALDDGSSGGLMPASGSGGVGSLEKPITADADTDGLSIFLTKPTRPSPGRP